jgi:hypothetical protein
MKLPFGSIFKNKLILWDCKTGKTEVITHFPAWIGGKEADFQVDQSDLALVEFEQHDEKAPPSLTLMGGGMAVINGVPSNRIEKLNNDVDYAILLGEHMILASWVRDPKKWLIYRQTDSWRLVSSDSAVLAGPSSLASLAQQSEMVFKVNDKAILNHASSNSGFFLRDVAKIMGWSISPSETFAPTAAPTVVFPGSGAGKIKTPELHSEPEPEINTDTGEFTCPVCWIRFDRGDLFHVASHESLKGDPLLGEEHMLRFSATRFNNAGQALDAMGIPSTETACPHCRRALPPSFIDMRQHIVSIVGAPSSGKSYYLSVLIRTLQNNLFTKFQSAFYDADPKENVRLTEMKNKLFSAATPEEASIAKTDLEGDMYIQVSRMGRRVNMPKPFIFNISPPEDVAEPLAVVFYDNAGEHFEPTRDSVSSPGAQHVASASGVLFLFDPTYSLEFRKRLRAETDPQLQDQRFDQQDTILAEMNARVKKLRGLDFKQRMETPLAVIVGKMDVWGRLLPENAFADPLTDSVLDIDLLRRNSDRVRKMLHEIVPAVVANAETISSNVRYFPVSTFGCSPQEIAPDPKTGRRRFSPDPIKLSPQYVDVPMLWLLSQIDSRLVRTQKKAP